MAEGVAIPSVPPNLNDPDERQAWRTASEAAEKFSSLFYRSLDKPGRPDLPGFYTENAILLWNGNRVESRSEVVAYWTKLPRSQTNLHTLSAQPIQKAISGGSSLVMVNVFGTIKFDGNPSKTFSETFFLIQESNLWRVQSDTFRFIE
ncbi:hypothetical protein AAHC03_0181 [Spirometra sp. Aus1]